MVLYGEFMKLKYLMLFISVSVFSLLNSLTYEIKQDGTGDFTNIQAGIDEATDNDTVLVYSNIHFKKIYKEIIKLTNFVLHIPFL